MIRIEGLTKTFRDGETRTTILDSLDLSVETGEFLALLGRSGSGKSTLLNCIAGIETPDSGSIRLGEDEIVGLDDDRRSLIRRDRIGFVFQFFNLLPILSVRENVALPALLQGRPRGEVHRRADALLAELGLEGRGDERPDHLSGGEQQRVATARALINDPLVLLADEPTGNLDGTTGAATLELLRDLNERLGVTIVMATHSREAAAAAGRAVRLQDGRLVDDPTEETVKEPEVTPSPTVEAPAEPDETPSGPMAAVGGAAVAAEGASEISAEQLAAIQAEIADDDPVENEAVDLEGQVAELEDDDRILEGGDPDDAGDTGDPAPTP